MPPSGSSPHRPKADNRPSPSDCHECQVHNLTAKVHLNRPADSLIPERYIRKAEHTPAVQRKPWIFRYTEDGRQINPKDWSNIDVRYRGVFKTLAKVPTFKKGLWESDCVECHDDLTLKNSRAQGQLIYALLSDVIELLDHKRVTKDGKSVFSLRSRLIESSLEYWTGYREKYRDGPKAAGFLALDLEPNIGDCLPIVPVSITTKEGSLTENLSDKFKLMLGQLLLHVRPLPLPADKLPDQEIFLLGIHGSKMHLMRAFFPGQKTSSLWCRRLVPGPQELTLIPHRSPLTSRRRAVSTPTPASIHIENYDADTEESSPGIECSNKQSITTPHSNSNSNPSSLEQDNLFKSNTETMTPLHRVSHHQNQYRRKRALSHPPRFYSEANIERFRRHLEAAKLRGLDHEPDLRTFRVLASREYDLWHRADFTAAVHLLVALQMYLLSGKARCGALQETFGKHPIFCDEESEESGSESDSFTDGMTGEEREKALRGEEESDSESQSRGEREREREKEELVAMQARENGGWEDFEWSFEDLKGLMGKSLLEFGCEHDGGVAQDPEATLEERW